MLVAAEVSFWVWLKSCVLPYFGNLTVSRERFLFMKDWGDDRRNSSPISSAAWYDDANAAYLLNVPFRRVACMFVVCGREPGKRRRTTTLPLPP